jgi:hypothetical protein
MSYVGFKNSNEVMPSLQTTLNGRSTIMTILCTVRVAATNKLQSEAGAGTRLPPKVQRHPLKEVWDEIRPDDSHAAALSLLGCLATVDEPAGSLQV